MIQPTTTSEKLCGNAWLETGSPECDPQACCENRKDLGVKATPILMQPHLVAATLRGEKTQTRRGRGLDVVNKTPEEWRFLMYDDPEYWFGAWFNNDRLGRSIFIPCPWGEPGDLAWVRETHCYINPRPASSDSRVLYFADLAPGESYAGVDRWRPSIHMHRWASRLTLRLKEVRVERVNEISNGDARAEGIVQTWGDFMGCPPKWALDSISEKYGAPGSHLYDNRQSRENFRLLYESINGPGSFDGRWNWVLVYEPIAENVDTVLARMEHVQAIQRAEAFVDPLRRPQHFYGIVPRKSK